MKKILYAGTFDPITNGHLDIIRRGSKLADELVICIFCNGEKKTVFDVHQREQMIKAATSGISNVSIDSYAGLLADYVNKNNIDIVLRGLRAGADFEYEISMAQLNNRFYKNTETIFLMTDPENSFISSSVVRDVYRHKGDISMLVPECVEALMREYDK